jgi:hypothetical protein
LAAATLTDWAAFAPATLSAHVAPQLISAEAPIVALVLMLETSTAPARLTAAVPEKPAPMPTTAMSSLFVAVTATPRNPPTVAFWITRGP